MNILSPMAGRGSRFKQQGYTVPKPFIDVAGRPMIARVIENIGIPWARYILIVLKEHLKYFHLLEGVLTDFTIIIVGQVTEGAACTCLLAENYINTDERLIIANCDQIEDWSNKNFYTSVISHDPDGCIVTFNSTDPKNSFVEFNGSLDGYISKTVEKKVISNIATTGIYYWKRGCDFVRSAKQMIVENDRTNNEFYVCPTYNYLIKEGKKISAYHICNHIPIGTPEDLRAYLKTIY